MLDKFLDVEAVSLDEDGTVVFDQRIITESRMPTAGAGLLGPDETNSFFCDYDYINSSNCNGTFNYSCFNETLCEQGANSMCSNPTACISDTNDAECSNQYESGCSGSRNPTSC
jgi:hypothetical protein